LISHNKFWACNQNRERESERKKERERKEEAKTGQKVTFSLFGVDGRSIKVVYFYF